MKIKKSIQLTTGPLDNLIDAGESIDFRLDQDMWKELQVGDYIEFWEDITGWQKVPAKGARRVIVEIRKIYKAPKFLELFLIIESDADNMDDTQKLLQGLRNWWSEDKEVAEGVLAFHVAVVK